MSVQKERIEDFITLLSSKAPTPGGGGASALCGAVAAALGSMVASLTIGKKKYADVETEITALKAEIDGVSSRLLMLADADARAFEPLAKAYMLPSGTQEEIEHKDKIMEAALYEASVVPLEIMKEIARAAELIEVFAEKGSVMAVSDAAAGAAICEGAVKAASLNIFINTKSMKNGAAKKELNTQANGILDSTTKLTRSIFDRVKKKLEG